MLLADCGTSVPAITEQGHLEEKFLAMCRIRTVITGETQRIYPPALRSFELLNRQAHERIRVEVESEDQEFFVALEPGE